MLLVSLATRALNVPLSPRGSKAQRAHNKAVIAERLRQLSELEDAVLPPCEACAAAQAALIDEEEGVPVSVNAHNRAMALCIDELPAVRALFAEVSDVGVANEGSYMQLLRSLVQSGELSEAVAVLQRVLDEGHFLPRVRSCAPLLQARRRRRRSSSAARASSRVR